MTTFQTSSMIGHDYEGISNNHNMVVVIAKKYGEEKHSGAAEPTGSTHQEIKLSLPLVQKSSLGSQREKRHVAQRVPNCWLGFIH